MLTLCLITLLSWTSISESQPDISISEQVDQSFERPLILEFNSEPTRSVTFVPALSYGFKCAVGSGNELIGSGWTRDGGDELTQLASLTNDLTSGIYLYSETSKSAYIIFKNFTDGMIGSYTCYTNVGNRTLVVGKGDVTVVLKNEVVTVSTTSSSSPLINFFRVPHPADNNVNVTIFHNGVDVLTLPDWIIFTTYISLDIIHMAPPFRLDYEGTYELRITTSAGSGSATFFLDIRIRPDITITPNCDCGNIITVPIGVNISLNCSDSVGDPLPSFTWTRNSQSVHDDNSLQVDAIGRRSSILSITNITHQLSGTYKCTARNVVGSNEQIVTIHVEFGPLVQPITPSHIEATAGRKIQLLINYGGGYPVPDVKWSRSVDGFLEDLDHSRVIFGGVIHLNVTINNAQLSDEGLYKLRVNNSISEANLEFNVSILVSPQLSNLTDLVFYRRIDECVTLKVGVYNATPPVSSTNLQWTANQSDLTASNVQYEWDGTVASLTWCDLTSDNTGTVQLMVYHDSNNVSVMTFELIVWYPPSPPLMFTAASIDTCTSLLTWSIQPSQPDIAPTDIVHVELIHCPLHDSIDCNRWSTYDMFSTDINSTIVYLLPDRVYRFRSTSYNELIGYGLPLVAAHEIKSEVKNYMPEVSSLSVTSRMPSSIIVTWDPPTSSNDCYTLSLYWLRCHDDKGSLVSNRTTIPSDSTVVVTITALSPDSAYNCSVCVQVRDHYNTTMYLTSSYAVGYTLPLPLTRPHPPSVPPSSSPSDTIVVELTDLKNSLVHQQDIGLVRLLVLRLGTTPTVPSESPDILYPSDDSFSSYQDVHDGLKESYPPYIAAEYDDIDDVPDQFIVGGEGTMRKRDVTPYNGPLADDNFYTVFVRIYARSKLGVQFSVFNSTSFSGPRGIEITQASPSDSGGAGVAVAIVIILMLCVVCGVVVVIVVILLVVLKKKKRRENRHQPIENNVYVSNGGIPSNKDDEPAAAAVSVPLSATNPSYDKLQPEPDTYVDTSMSPTSTSPTPNAEKPHLSDTSSITGNSSSDITLHNVSETESQQADGLNSPVNIACQLIHRDKFADFLEKLDDNNQEGFISDFKEIQLDSHIYRSVTSTRATELGKNRYKNIIAFDHSRVHLKPIDGVALSDYINANFVRGYSDNKYYIATQGPKMETCADFWRMVWEQNTVTIVMLTNLEENDKVKCFQYWPEEKEQEYGDIVVRVDRDIILPHYTIRGFKVFNRATNDEERTVLQFHYTAWPDNNVPAQAAPLLDFLRAINSANESDAYGPMVVHCSAGVGRTGTIISLDIALAQLKDTGFVDVKGIVKFLRQQRIEMVQVVEQYVFIHHAILEDIIYGDTSVLLKDFIDHYNALQSSPGMPIDGEYYKIGKVRPPAQAFAGPNIVPSIKDIPCDDDLFIAHYLDSYWIPNFFVATSCPSNGNIERFWQLVWDQKATHIVNLTPQDSSAVFNYMKGKEMIINNMRIKIDSTEIKKGYILRKVIIIREEKGNDVSLVVYHMEYKEWTSVKSVPRTDKFVKFILECLRESENAYHRGNPMILHDDGSNGQVGVFAAVSYCFQRAKKERIVDILQAVNRHHLQCPDIISSLVRYAYCYDCLKEYSEKLHKEESVPPIYENIASFRGKLQPSPEPIVVDANHQFANSLDYDIL